MPTEHEYKYVLSMDAVGGEAKIAGAADESLSIRQGYLAFSKGMTTRVRSVASGGKQKWFLTFKQKVGDRVVEIEKRLDERDGMDLWGVCVGKLEKCRYVFRRNEAEWDVDFFKKGGQVYFVLAEVELPEGAARPVVPDFIKPLLVHVVRPDDDRFSNKRLGDVDYSIKLYAKLKSSYTTA